MLNLLVQESILEQIWSHLLFSASMVIKTTNLFCQCLRDILLGLGFDDKNLQHQKERINRQIRTKKRNPRAKHWAVILMPLLFDNTLMPMM